jgi:hypothetical protein
MDEVSKLIGQRNTMLFWVAISFAVWQGGGDDHDAQLCRQAGQEPQAGGDSG